MNKLEFISRQLAKAQNKRYEHYVVNRVWNLLNDFRVKFVTQQFVTRPQGRAMTDMFFPQLNVHIEVDEGHHKQQIEADQLREADIIDATGHEILRVDVTKEIDSVNIRIDEIVALLRSKVESDPDFTPWDMEAEMDPLTYIEKGYLDVADNVSFRTIAEAATCFGKDYRGGMQLSFFPHPTEPNKKLWFPRLYENEEWFNYLSDDEGTITCYCKDPERKKAHIDKMLLDAREFPTRLVFARVKGSLGDVMYRFKGEYQFDLEATNYDSGTVLHRISTRVKTYPLTAVEPLRSSPNEVQNSLDEIYRDHVLPLSKNERLRLASLILADLSTD